MMKKPGRPLRKWSRRWSRRGADVNTMTFGQILEEGSGGGYAVVGIFEDDSVLDLARNSDCSEVVAILKEAGACENLEGRRFEWGRVSGWAAILGFSAGGIQAV